MEFAEDLALESDTNALKMTLIIICYWFYCVVLGVPWYSILDANDRFHRVLRRMFAATPGYSLPLLLLSIATPLSWSTCSLLLPHHRSLTSRLGFQTI